MRLLTTCPSAITRLVNTCKVTVVGTMHSFHTTELDG